MLRVRDIFPSARVKKKKTIKTEPFIFHSPVIVRKPFLPTVRDTRATGHLNF